MPAADNTGLTAVGNTGWISLARGKNNVVVACRDAGSLVGATTILELSLDGGTTALDSGLVSISGEGATAIQGLGGMDSDVLARARLSAITSGTADIYIRA